MLFSKFGRQNADDEYLNKMKQHKWQQDNAHRCRVVKKYFGEYRAVDQRFFCTTKLGCNTVFYSEV